MKIVTPLRGLAWWLPGHRGLVAHGYLHHAATRLRLFAARPPRAGRPRLFTSRRDAAERVYMQDRIRLPYGVRRPYFMHMANTYTQIYYHIVFSTKNRARAILPDGREDLYRYLWGIHRNLKCHVYRIGGVEDHVHILTSIHPTLALAKYPKK